MTNVINLITTKLFDVTCGSYCNYSPDEARSFVTINAAFEGVIEDVSQWVDVPFACQEDATIESLMGEFDPFARCNRVPLSDVFVCLWV